VQSSDLLRPWSQSHRPVEVPKVHLVILGDVDPDVIGPVDVAGPHDGHFIRPHPREPLERDHRLDLRWGNGKHRIHMWVGRGLDLPSLRDPCIAPFVQPFHSQQGLMHLDRDQLLGYPPLEHSLDDRHLVVDVDAVDSSPAFLPVLDNLFSHYMEGARAEVAGEFLSVKLLNESQGAFDIPLSLRGLTTILVVDLNELPPVEEDEFIDREEHPLTSGEQHGFLAFGKVLRNHASILGVALRRAVGAEVDVPPVDANDRLATRLTRTIGGDSARSSRHVRLVSSVVLRKNTRFQVALPVVGRRRKYLRLKCFCKSGRPAMDIS
jgi:hypothetical protein